MTHSVSTGRENCLEKSRLAELCGGLSVKKAIGSFAEGVAGSALAHLLTSIVGRAKDQPGGKERSLRNEFPNPTAAQKIALDLLEKRAISEFIEASQRALHEYVALKSKLEKIGKVNSEISTRIGIFSVAMLDHRRLHDLIERIKSMSPAEYVNHILSRKKEAPSKRSALRAEFRQREGYEPSDEEFEYHEEMVVYEVIQGTLEENLTRCAFKLLDGRMNAQDYLKVITEFNQRYPEVMSLFMANQSIY